MKARTLPQAALLAVLLSAGCGASGGGAGGIRNAGPNPNDKRAVAFACIRDGKGLDARLSGQKSIQVDGPDGPRVEFFVSSGEAEGQQFQGKAQNAEQIGAALLFVNQAPEELLKQVEACLDDQ